MQERIRRQADLAEQIRAAAEAEDAEPDCQSATPAGTLHCRLKAAAEVQQEADGEQPRGEFKDFRSTKKEALDEEREEQRLIHQ